MSQTFAQTIDGNYIYAERSVGDKLGNDITTTYEPTLPTKTGNAGKVLTVNSGATGLEWTSVTTPPTKPVVAGTGITITENANDITLAATAQAPSLVHHSESVAITAGTYSPAVTFNLNCYVPAGKSFSGSITIQNLANTSTSGAYHFSLYVPNNEMTCNFGDYPSARQSGHNIATTVDNTSSATAYQLYFELGGVFEAQTITVNVNGITF